MSLEFEEVHFQHPKKPALFTGESLMIPTGTSVGFVGPSGCGKTTFAQLSLRFFDPQRGCVRFNGRPLVDCLSAHDFRRKMGFVQQTPCIFASTVRANLTFGNPQPDNVLIDMIDRVRPELWGTLGQGLDTELGEGGVRLSGGERQCIAIMREILKPVEFILFDEATSALDAESQIVAQAAIDNSLQDGRTIIVIAHRLETVHRCDFICSFGKRADGSSVIEAVGKNIAETAERSPTLKRTLLAASQYR